MDGWMDGWTNKTDRSNTLHIRVFIMCDLIMRDSKKPKPAAFFRKIYGLETRAQTLGCIVQCNPMYV
jgi:hypothetical protein